MYSALWCMLWICCLDEVLWCGLFVGLLTCDFFAAVFATGLDCVVAGAVAFFTDLFWCLCILIV